MKLDYCGTNESCFSYMDRVKLISSFSSNIWRFNITAGYNFYPLSQPFSVSKGSFLYLLASSGQVAVSKTDVFYPDFDWMNLVSDSSVYYSNLFEARKFLVNAVINNTFYAKRVYLTTVMPSSVKVDLSSKFLATSNLYNRTQIQPNSNQS